MFALYIHTLSCLSDTSDGVIYVFLYAPVRNILNTRASSIKSRITRRMVHLHIVSDQSPNVPKPPTNNETSEILLERNFIIIHMHSKAYIVI